MRNWGLGDRPTLAETPISDVLCRFDTNLGQIWVGVDQARSDVWPMFEQLLGNLGRQRGDFGFLGHMERRNDANLDTLHEQRSAFPGRARRYS